MKYDFAVIGAGPGGYVAAEKAGKAGLGTVLFEPASFGGVCLNEGCIPTKTLLHCAKTYASAKGGEKSGITAAEFSYDWSKMQERKVRVIRRLAGGIKAGLRDAGVTVVPSAAQIRGRNASGDIVIEAGGETYEAGKLLVCTGSEPVIPPIPGLNESDAVCTSTRLLEIEEVPESLVIVGGGVIGMEFASLFNMLGTKVSVVEMAGEILGGMDTEAAALIRGIYSKRGVEFHLGCRVSAIEGCEVVFTDPSGAVCRVGGEKILLSVGRRPRLNGYGLETLEVRCDRGIGVDSHMRTSAPGVYAAGDVTGFSMLAHTASREGEVAVNDILGVDDEMSYRAVPGVVYTSPEAASVGLTEEQAPQADVFRIPMAFSGRYVSENEDIAGFCKIVAEKGSGRILGLHMVGTPCSEIISSGCLAIEAGLTLQDLRRTVFPHPSVSEILKAGI